MSVQPERPLEVRAQEAEVFVKRDQLDIRDAERITRDHLERRLAAVANEDAVGRALIETQRRLPLRWTSAWSRDTCCGADVDVTVRSTSGAGAEPSVNERFSGESLSSRSRPTTRNAVTGSAGGSPTARSSARTAVPPTFFFASRSRFIRPQSTEARARGARV